MDRNDLERTRSRPRPWEVQMTGSNDSDTTNNIADSVERRRMQNRLAQRNHRRRVRAYISALEGRVVENMLQAAPKETDIPSLSSENNVSTPSLAAPASSSSSSSSTPAPISPASQYSTFATPMPLNSQSNPGIEETLDLSLDFPQTVDLSLDFPQTADLSLDFPQTVDGACASHTMASQDWGPASATGCASIPPGCSTCFDMSQPLTTNNSCSRESCCKLHTELPPSCHSRVHSPPWQDPGTFSYGGEFGANLRGPSGKHPHRPSALMPSHSTMQQHFNNTQSVHTPGLQHCHCYRLPSWNSPVSLCPERISMHMPTDLRTSQMQPSLAHSPSVISLHRQMHQDCVLNSAPRLYPPFSHNAGYPWDRVYPCHCPK